MLARPVKLQMLFAALLLTTIISIVLLLGATSYYSVKSKGEKFRAQQVEISEKLMDKAAQHLESEGQYLIGEKAHDIAMQISLLYRSGHPDPAELRRIAVQLVGKTGYSCLYECGTGLMLVHPNPKLNNFDMKQLAPQLPSWWEVFAPSLSCREHSGYYNWKDPDGSIKQKYMAMAPVPGTHLMVAATTYLDEFSAKIKDLRQEANTKNSHLTAEFTRFLRDNLTFTLIAAALICAALCCFGVYISRLVSRNFSELRNFAHELSVGNYAYDIGDSSQILEFRELTGDLRTMRQEIISLQTEKMSSAGALATARISRQVAHDLRSPLAALTSIMRQMRAQTSSRKELDEVAFSTLELVTRHLKDMVQDILKPQQNFLGTLTKFSISELISRAVSTVDAKYAISSKQIEFKVELEPHEEFLGSESNLSRVLINLLQNSVEAIDDLGVINVRGYSDEAAASYVIAIEDNGRGIPPQVIGDVLKEGFSFNKPGGTGLGLFIVQQIISEHGGDLRLKSQAGEGTSIEIILPVLQKQKKGSAAAIKSIAVEPGQRILVVDDSVKMLTNWYRLALQAGIEGDFFSSFEEMDHALGSEDFGRYDVVILDYLFPNSRFNGIEVYQKIRPRCAPATKFVFATSAFADAHIREFSQTHQIEVFPKNYDFSVDFA